MVFTFILNAYSPHYAQGTPTVVDDHLQLDLVVEGLRLPTAKEFSAADDILVLEKDSGKVRRVLNGSIFPEPLVDLAVATEHERGLLGIAAANRTHNGTTHTYIILYFTVSKISKDGFDNCPPPEPYYCE